MAALAEAILAIVSAGLSFLSAAVYGKRRSGKKVTKVNTGQRVLAGITGAGVLVFALLFVGFVFAAATQIHLL